MALGPDGGQAAHFVMDRALQDRLLLAPFVAIASDGAPGGSHPRGAGTFARWIGEFAVRGHPIGIEEAVRKATSLPASILGLRDRGVVREGARADLVLFDPASVRARADYIDPTALAEGFDLVLGHAHPAFEGGTAVERAGPLLRKPARARPALPAGPRAPRVPHSTGCARTARAAAPCAPCPR